MWNKDELCKSKFFVCDDSWKHTLSVPHDTSRIEKLEKRRYAIEGRNKPSIISADKTDRYSALRGAK